VGVIMCVGAVVVWRLILEGCFGGVVGRWVSVI